MTGNLHVANSPESVAKSFAEFFKAKAQNSERFNVALSGGSTPKLLFKILSSEYATDIHWTSIHFYWGDERCVSPTNNESNYKMTNELLFKPLNIPQSNIHRVRGEDDPELEASRYSRELLKCLPNVNSLPQFDLIILGMGEDGHTASIFPHEMELLKVDQICAVAEHPVSGQKRVTITGETINNALDVAFLLTGKGKVEKIDAIFNKKNDWQSFPASHILPVSGSLHWFLDEAALPDENK